MYIEDNNIKDVIINKYSNEKSIVLERANRLLLGKYTFQNEWDMERSNEVVNLGLKNIDYKFLPNKDMEWTYMFHRFSYLMDLVIAYIFTDEVKYIIFLKEFLEDYVKYNKLNEDNKEYSFRTIDTAIRLNNLLRINEILNKLGYSLSEEILNEMNFYYEYCLKELRVERTMSNWVAIEASSLIAYNKYFSKSKDELKFMVEIYEMCLSNQIPEDGIQWEQSFMYHHEVLITTLHAVVALKSEISPFILSKAKAMAEASSKFMSLNYDQINFGDSDFEDMRSILLASEKILGISLLDYAVKSTLYDYLISGIVTIALVLKLMKIYNKIISRIVVFLLLKITRVNHHFIFLMVP